LIREGGLIRLPPFLGGTMIPGLLIGLFVILQPFTVSTSHLLCNQGKCPKIHCFIGWQYRGYDMNGRLFSTCRSHTRIGYIFYDAHRKLMRKVKEDWDY